MVSPCTGDTPLPPLGCKCSRNLASNFCPGSLMAANVTTQLGRTPCLSIRLYAYLSTCLCISLLLCLFDCSCPCICLFVYRSVSAYLSKCEYICFYECQSVCLSVSLPVCTQNVAYAGPMRYTETSPNVAKKYFAPPFIATELRSHRSPC